MKRSWRAAIKAPGIFGPPGVALYLSLSPQQPLLLEREPNAVKVSDVLGMPCGYIERNVAAEIARIIDSGKLVLARVHSPAGVLPDGKMAGHHEHPAVAFLWIDDDEERAKKKKAWLSLKERLRSGAPIHANCRCVPRPIKWDEFGRPYG